MAKVQVQLIRNGRKIKKITRPLCSFNGQPAVRYRRRLWIIANGNEIYVDKHDPGCQPDQDNISPVHSYNKPEGNTTHGPPVTWDKHQRLVISSSPESRMIVSAGPGTGKTAVACARAADLIKQGLDPNHIWLISFTRTAVREIRDRIADYLGDEGAAYAVTVATLDSHAWAIHSGFDETARIIGSYEENIDKARDLLLGNEGAAEYLQTVEHLIIDEAQDIVGVRAEFVLTLIEKLPRECGVSVFADEAQAIYGFADSEEDGGRTERQPPLPEKIRERFPSGFEEKDLLEVHRTDSDRLLTIFTDLRRLVLLPSSPGKDGKNKLTEIKAEVRRLAHDEVRPGYDHSLAGLNDGFILYRRRCDVLLASSFLRSYPHRIRMSGLPVSIAPWVGVTLAEYKAPVLDEETFMDLWWSQVASGPLAACSAEKAWETLVRIAGRTRQSVDMRILRQRLGRKQPPAEICAAEAGDRGPIIGTIHACKGREADVVHLMLPDNSDSCPDQDEEARIVFVGATRGRLKLLVGQGYHQRANRIESSGRVFCIKARDKKVRAQVEIGLDGDITAEGVAGRNHFSAAAIVRACQTSLKRYAGNTVSMAAELDPKSGFVYRLKEDGKEICLCVLSQKVNSDLFSIGQQIRGKAGGGERRTPDIIPYLYARGVRSIVLPPDAPECERLHEPWASTGIMLAPVVIGYPSLFFPLRSSRRRNYERDYP